MSLIFQAIFFSRVEGWVKEVTFLQNENIIVLQGD